MMMVFALVFVLVFVSSFVLLREMLMKKHDLTRDQILYMGDDLPDYEVMDVAGLRCCPADAVAQIKAKCHFISSYPGGKGCVRDLLEQAMRLQGKWPYSTH